MQTRAAITGASGLVGANLAARLCAAGDVGVAAVHRSGSDLRHLEELRRDSGGSLELREADLLDDGDSLTRAFFNCEVIFHCAASVSLAANPEAARETERVNVEGSRRVIAAARAAGARRIVFCSSGDAIGLAPDPTHAQLQPGALPAADEDAPWRWEEQGVANPYARSKRAAEALLLAAARAGELETVIVNPGFVVGPRDSGRSSGRLLDALAAGRLWFAPPGFSSFLAASAAARGLEAAWRRGRSGERYILGGENLSYFTFFRMVQRIAGASAVAPPLLTLPEAAVLLLGQAGEWLQAFGGDFEWNAATARLICRNKALDSSKARRELGYATDMAELERALRDRFAERA